MLEMIKCPLLDDRQRQPELPQKSTERRRHRCMYRPPRHKHRHNSNTLISQFVASTTIASCLLFIVAVTTLPAPTDASPLECGKILTTPCVSWSDPRYNPHQLNSLTSQSPLWSMASGLWVVSHRAYEPNGQPKSNSPYTARGSFPYRRDSYRTYRNVTLTDTRLYVHEVSVYLPPSQSSSDCWMSNIPNSPQKHYGDAIGSDAGAAATGETDGGDTAAAASSAGGGGPSARKSCGTHGSLSYREIFGTVSPEKDGTVDVFWLNDMEYGDILDYHHGPTGPGSAVRPVGNDTMLYRITTEDGGMLSTWTDVLTANHRFEGSGTRIVAHDDANGRPDDTTHILYNATRSVFEDAWTKDLLRAMHEANVPDQERMTLSLRLSRHHSDGCLFGQFQCPSDEDFCSLGQDPSCGGTTSSPYQEPVAGVRFAAVVSISLVCAITALVLGVKAHRHILYTRLTSQELHHRDYFVSQVAKRIDMRTSTSQLPAEKLTAMVLHIADGLREASPEYRPIIGKEELWEFMASGVAGKMYEIDFDLLFRAIDVRALGRIDFVDYIVYLSMCGKSFSEIDEALFDAAVDEEEIIERACKRISASWGADREKDNGRTGNGFNFPSM